VSGWFFGIERLIRLAITGLTGVLLVLMVVFTLYTVVMRYVFHDAPFWGDTVAMFANIWLVLLAYSLAVRDREEIASQGLYVFLPLTLVALLRRIWQLLSLAMGLFLAWFGLDAALSVPGRYWELGGLPKMVPMLIMPLAGLLIALAASLNVLEDVSRQRGSQK
jgi:TRAP-type C4-dicarboxylate transport system permease small subunit